MMQCCTDTSAQHRAGLHHLELRVKIGYFLIGATYIATELSILLGCQPLQKNWQMYPDPGSQYSSRWRCAITDQPCRFLSAGHIQD
jgi:hypothetical protein